MEIHWRNTHCELLLSFEDLRELFRRCDVTLPEDATLDLGRRDGSRGYQENHRLASHWKEKDTLVLTIRPPRADSERSEIFRRDV